MRRYGWWPFALHPIRFGPGHASIPHGWRNIAGVRTGTWHIAGRWYLYCRFGRRTYP